MDGEQFDVLDCAGRITGGIIGRDEAHAAGAWHGAFHCLLVYRRHGRAVALFQQRSRTKKIAPGRLDVSVGGHYSAGETAVTAGPREISEELGLTVSFGQLVPLGRRVFVYCFSPGVRECEFQDVFLLPMSGAPQNLVLQQDEVDAVLELDLEQGIELLTGRRETATATVRTGGADEFLLPVYADAFVPCLDNYYLKLLVLARRYDQGERHALMI